MWSCWFGRGMRRRLPRAGRGGRVRPERRTGWCWRLFWTCRWCWCLASISWPPWLFQKMEGRRTLIVPLILLIFVWIVKGIFGVRGSLPLLQISSRRSTTHADRCRCFSATEPTTANTRHQITSPPPTSSQNVIRRTRHRRHVHPLQISRRHNIPPTTQRHHLRLAPTLQRPPPLQTRKRPLQRPLQIRPESPTRQMGLQPTN